MFRADHDIHIDAPPGKVWDLVTRFDAYRSWTHWIAISGQLTLGAELEYRIFLRRKKGGPRPLSIPAEITEIVSGRRVTWGLGYSRLIRFVRTFEVVPEGPGARLSHSFEAHGLLSGIIGPRMAIMARAPSQGVLEDAKRRLEGGVRPKPPTPPKSKTPRYLPRPVRRGRR